MNRLGLSFFFLFLALAFQAFPQKRISGRVLDAVTSEPLSFVNIGIINRDVGTTTDVDGQFDIMIPKEYESDRLTFSLIGYEQSSFLIGSLNPPHQIIHLTQKETHLEQIDVIGERLVERKFGIKNRNLLVHFSDGMFQKDDVFEIGQLIKLKGASAQITSVNIYLFESERDSVSFRLNFYGIENGKPTRRLIDRPIVRRYGVEQGWLRLDISEENIQLKGDFVVALEFLPEKKQSGQIAYEVKLGGSSRSFYRKSSLGTWNTPPHHYCVYVTALVDQSVQEEPEEAESLPVATLWSEQLRDSFSVFLRLPSDYRKDKKKTYPVLYCLDANAYFDHLSSFLDDLSAKDSLHTEPILVGIGYENAYLMDSLRVRDLTFPKAQPSDSMPLSGRGDDFYRFIKSTVIPYVDENYRSDTTERTILGHSFAGYFADYALLSDLTQGQLFKNYVSASPSLWYAEGYLIKQFNALGATHEAADGSTVFLSIGQQELNFGNEVYFTSFRDSLSKLPFLKLKTKVHPQLDHMGAAIPAFEDALKVLYGSKDLEN